jgi:hypothetical protein
MNQLVLFARPAKPGQYAAPKLSDLSMLESLHLSMFTGAWDVMNVLHPVLEMLSCDLLL